MDLNTDREQRIASLRAGVESLRASGDRLSASLSAGLPEEVPDPGVQIFYGPDGVMESVHIDDETRSAFTGAELMHKVTLALATAPVPAAVVQRLLRDPEALRAMRDHGAGDEPTTHTSPDAAVTLTTVHGRPIEVRATEGSLLSTSTGDLGASIVALARKAASDEGMGHR